MSSSDTFNSAISLAGANAQLTALPLSQSGSDQLNALDLTKDSSGAITLDKGNLQKMAAAKLLDFDAASGQYTLSVTLLAPSQNRATATIVPSPSDGLFSVSSTAQATKSLLSPEAASSAQVETTPLTALQSQAAAPTPNHENPYLQGQQGKLMILMYELLFIQEKIAVYDKDSGQKTFARAIDNVQMQAAAIAEKYDANDVRLKGDITAAQMTIGVDVLGLALQLGAILGLGLLDKAGKKASSASSGSDESPTDDHLTLTVEKRAEQEQKSASASASDRLKEQEEIENASETAPLLRKDSSEIASSGGEVGVGRQPLSSRQTEDASLRDVEMEPAHSSFSTAGQEGIGGQLTLTPEHEGATDQLTLTPEHRALDSAASKSDEQLSGAGGIKSKLSGLARAGLQALLGENGLNNAFESMARNYIQIAHSTANIDANNLSMVAEQSMASIALQKAMIQQQLSANRNQSKQTGENVQNLLDLVSNLSRTRLENERTLFRG